MIYVNRSRVPAPEILRSDRANAARERAAAFFRLPFARRAQQRFEFDTEILVETRGDLCLLFNGRKCAYCESEVSDTNTVEVDHFRPKSEPVGLAGQDLRESSALPGSDIDGYWWLAYEWENLYPVCSVCNRNKRNRFPVAHRRARPSMVGAALLDECALLLDPCVDDPQHYLVFQHDGLVSPRQPLEPDQLAKYGGYHRGEVTIEVLGLNRIELVEARAQTANDVLLLFETALRSLGRMDNTDARKHELARMIEQVLSVERPYLALRRQVLSDVWKRKMPSRYPFSLDHKMLGVALQPAAAGQIPIPATPPSYVQVVAPQLAIEQPVAEGSLETFVAPKPPGPPGRVRARVRKRAPRKRVLRGVRTPYIRKIEIENFKAISKLHLEFSEGKDWRVGWKVLLGENGTGKSSVLQAVALALMGPKYLKSLRVKPRQWLRRLPGGKRAKRAVVRLHFSTEPAPLELRFTERGVVYTGGLENARVFLRAYGATRRLPRHSIRVPKVSPLMRVDPLFDPVVRLHDASVWMRDLPKRWFNTVALTIKDLLQLESRAPLRRLRNGVNAVIGGVRITLDELSDGYQSVLAMVADILAGAPEKLRDMRNVVGIVLLDEIDAHLHPRWKMCIVASLRRAFPRLQFLVTTHEPLCLRGLEDNEITLMRRIGRQIVAEHDLPSPRGLRVDQILTSPLFGLGSTIDPEVDRDFMDYYALLLKPDEALTDQQRELRERLKVRLKPYRILGDTRRDQLIAEVVDEYLAKEVTLTDSAQRLQIRNETKQRVAELWKQVNLLTDTES
jgi:uncharacterized protein (TIGR02646 family)